MGQSAPRTGEEVSAGQAKSLLGWQDWGPQNGRPLASIFPPTPPYSHLPAINSL